MDAFKDDDNASSSPDDPVRDEPLTLTAEAPVQQWLIRMLARVCLILAPVLRRWFPEKWNAIATFYLHSLAWNGETSLVSRYLKNGADPNRLCYLLDADFGTTPLGAAAAQGHVRVAELLLGAGADVNGCDTAGRTALMEAAQFGQTEMVTLLLNSGARIDDTERIIPQTALFAATSGGHLPVVKLLVAHGANTNYRVRGRVRASDWARQIGGRAARDCADYLDSLPENQKPLLS